MEWSDKEYILKSIRKNGMDLSRALEKIRSDKEIVTEACKQYGKNLEFVINPLKDNKEVVLEAVKNNELSLRFASDRLKDFFCNSWEHKLANDKLNDLSNDFEK